MRTDRLRLWWIVATVALLVSVSSGIDGTGDRARIKDVARVQGVRSNQLFGVGIVVGLDGTGDTQQTLFTTQALENLLAQLGLNIDGTRIRTENIAAVMVTTELPAFAKEGDRIDVTVSSMGNAETLQGGLLIQTPLQAADGDVYAVAQGAVTIGGFNAGGGAGGAGVRKNHPTVGRIHNGAIVEQEVEMEMVEGRALTVSLFQSDFTTAAKAAEQINKELPQVVAQALDGSSIRIQLPPDAEFNLVELIAQIESVEIDVDAPAKIVINERTGTVVMGGDVRIKPVAVAHASLTVQITTTPIISQPPPLSSGATVVAAKTTIEVDEGEGSSLMPVMGGSTIDDVVSSLNAIGATPRDMMAILQAMKAAGGILADIEVQ